LKSGKGKVLKADQSVLQWLIIAYEAGQRVDLNQILCHELLPVPIALSEMNEFFAQDQKQFYLKFL
jgi:hypothetical protein